MAANFHLCDIDFRFVSKKLELSGDDGVVQTTIVVKQLQHRKCFYNLTTGTEEYADWQDVEEVTEDDILAEEESAPTDEIPLDTPDVPI